VPDSARLVHTFHSWQAGGMSDVRFEYRFDLPLREPYIKRTDHCWTLQELRERPLHNFPYVNDPRNRL